MLEFAPQFETSVIYSALSRLAILIVRADTMPRPDAWAFRLIGDANERAWLGTPGL